MKSKKKTLLLVEDEMITAMVEKKELEKEGYNVIHAPSGEKAIEIVNSAKKMIDLILMDIDLGKGIDGTSAAREILKDFDVPVLFLSSHTEKEVVDKTEKITSYGYVVKNSVNTVLMASIKMAFKLFNAHKNIQQQKKEVERKSLELQKANMELYAANEEFESINEQLMQSENELLKSESFLNSIIDQSPNPMWISDNRGTLIRINKACLDLLNLKEEELIGKYNVFEDNIVQEQGFVPLIKSVYEKGEIARFEIIWDSSLLENVKIKKFASVILDVNIFPIRDGNGNITNAVIQHKDITERKLAEETLKASEYRMRKHLAETPVAVIEWDTDFRITGWNPAAEKMFGYAASEAIGKKSSIIVPDDTIEQVDDVWKQLLANRGGVRSINKNITKKGRIITCNWHNTMLTSLKGEFIGVASIAQDITKQKQNEEEINNLLRDKEFILREVQHRIKNNMNTIESLLSLQAGSQDNPDVKNILYDAIGRVQSMRVLYDRLYRSESNDMLNIRDYITSLFNEIINIFPQKNKIKAEINIEDIVLNSKTLSALGVIVNELITNAMKYAFTDKKDGKISVTVFKKNKHIIMQFADNGTGLPESVTIEKSNGLGLQLIGMLVEQINGSISIERKKGTLFIIDFEV